MEDGHAPKDTMQKNKMLKNIYLISQNYANPKNQCNKTLKIHNIYRRLKTYEIRKSIREKVTIADKYDQF